MNDVSITQHNNHRQDAGVAAATTAKQTAQRLAELGYAVVRVYEMRDGVCGCGNANCSSPGKHPIGGDKAWTRDPEQVELWWSQRPSAGLGLNLAESKLVDVSTDNAGVLVDFRKRGLVETASFESGSGPGHEHHLYRRPDDCPTVRKCESQVLDLMSLGIAVLPPSVSGRGEYRWIEPLEQSVDALPLAPKWVVDELVQQSERDQQANIDRSQPPVALFGDDLERWHGRIVEPSDSSLSLVKIAGVLARAGMTANGIFDAVAERDRALFNKYTERSDREVRYAEIAASAIERYGLSVDINLDPGYAWADEIDTVTARPFLVDDLIYEKSITMVWGQPGSMKSYAMLDLAAHIATGKPWLDRVVGHGAVVYAAAEGAEGLKFRLKAWRQHHDMLDQRLDIALTDTVPDFNNPSEVDTLLRRLVHIQNERDTPIKLIVIDTFADAASGDENTRHGTQPVFQAIRRIQRDFDCAVIFIHHIAKSADEADGPRGFGGILGVLDHGFGVKLNGERTLMTTRKQRDLGGVGKAVAEWRVHTEHFDLRHPRTGAVTRRSAAVLYEHKIPVELTQEQIVSGVIASVDLTIPDLDPDANHRRVLQVLIDNAGTVPSKTGFYESFGVRNSTRINPYLIQLRDHGLIRIAETTAKNAPKAVTLTTLGWEFAESLGMGSRKEEE